jgi:hypothetical protein
VCKRTFRRYIDRYHDAGLEGLMDKRTSEVSSRKAPVDEVLRMETLYRERYDGWSVKHFFERYQDEHQGRRSYTWVKSRLQESDLAPRSSRRDKQRRRRPGAPLTGMMIHQDGSTHEWVQGQAWDLFVTMDDANSKIYSAFFVVEEGTLSSFQGVRETLFKKALFSSFLTQFGRTMNQLGIQMIVAYSSEARGRSERFFRTMQERLPKELALANITTMEEANTFLRRSYLKRFNRQFMVDPAESGSAFVPLLGVDIDNILCRQVERKVTRDSCVSYQGLTLQLPKGPHCRHLARKTVRVHQYPDGALAIYHGPRCLAAYTADGVLKKPSRKAAA